MVALQSWTRSQLASKTMRADLIREDDLQAQSRQFLSAPTAALERAWTTATARSPAATRSTSPSRSSAADLILFIATLGGSS